MPQSSKHRICCLEPIAYVGEWAVGWICGCGQVYHDAEYYHLEKGIQDYLTGGLNWERVIGL